MEKVNYAFTVLVLLACSHATMAQATGSLQQRDVTSTLDSWVTHTETLVVGLADAMPEDRYSFAPPATFGQFKGVRTFAQQMKHLASNNYRMAALVLGEKPTADMSDETGPDSARTKVQIMEYVRGSFAALHRAVATIDARNLGQPIASPSQWQKTRLSFVIDALNHDMDHYGQLVEYLRMNGLIPPESRPKL